MALQARLFSCTALVAAAWLGSSSLVLAGPSTLIQDQGADGIDGYSAFWEDDRDQNVAPTPGADGPGIDVTYPGGPGGALTEGVFLQSSGGTGGDAYEPQSYTFYPDPAPVDGQPGGDGGTITVVASADISAPGNGSQPVMGIVSNGGNGGAGQNFEFEQTASGDGGNGGSVSLTFDAPEATDGTASAQPQVGQQVTAGAETVTGVTVTANGGIGGSAASSSSFAPAQGGAGGDGGDIAVTLNDVYIGVNDNGSRFGILARANGGDGGAGGPVTRPAEATSNGGDGGQGGQVTIDVASAARILADNGNSNDRIVGILAEANGGAGGAPGAYAYDSAAGGSRGGGSVAIGNAGTVETVGIGGYGIVGQSFGGGGGAGGSPSVGFFEAAGTSGGAGGAGGDVTIVNRTGGTVTTAGTGSAGIVAQSVAGGGGNGARAVGIVSVGGNGGSSGNGGGVSVTNAGAVSTAGRGASGLIALSAGGGGGVALGADAAAAAKQPAGSGGTADGFFFGGGGDGGAGGIGGNVGVSQTGSIATEGSNSHGLQALSIGGGGGVGGGSFAGAPFVDVTVGGQGGAGGDAGLVLINDGIAQPPATPLGGIETRRVGSTGIHAASIGGGGGDGGGAFGVGAGLPVDGISVAISVAVGGTGGAAGNGGAVALNNVSTVTTYDDDSIGILAKSVGGGGGAGGAATSYAGTISARELKTTGFSVSIGVSVGGDGTGGGDGGVVTVNNWAPVTTHGDHSVGIEAHSIGGGGGVGANALAHASTYGMGYGVNAGIDVAVGGSGGVAGDGGPVTLTSTQAVTTTGNYADAVAARSVGGGGGRGGTGTTYSTPAEFVFGKSNTINVGIGGAGAGGGDAGTVTITNSGAIATAGTDSRGILAQSVGGGGGAGGGAQDDGNATQATVQVAVGRTGGGAGNGNTVTVANQAGGTIATATHGASGIIAQSVGGGGGVGGTATISNTSTGLGGDADTARTVLGFADKIYRLYDKAGILPEKAYPSSVDFSVAVGGSGGSAGNGGSVIVENDAAISTAGDRANAILAQSIGGGGGVAGAASAADEITGGNVVVGSDGGAGGSGGSVYVGNSAALSTQGNFSMGVLAQSVGGGGGIGGTTTTSGSLVKTTALSVRIGGNAGEGSPADEVTIKNSGDVQTQGHYAYGLAAQSIGGGGGLQFTNIQKIDKGGNAQTVKAPVYAMPGKPSAAGGGSGDGTVGISYGLGGTGGGGGVGGAVSIINSGNIVSGGDEAFGILAQSIGGGGGVGGSASEFLNGASDANAGKGGAGGNGADVGITLEAGSAITTRGTGSSAVVAQSIGGGGGHVGGGQNAQTQNTQPSITWATDGLAGQVSITTAEGAAPSITTTGYGAHGIFAQSSSGFGGSYGTFMGMLSATDLTRAEFLGDGFASATKGITIDYNGSIRATGEGAVAIYAEATQLNSGSNANQYGDGPLPHDFYGDNPSAGSEGNGQIAITVDGTIAGGSGNRGAGIALVGGRGNTIDIAGGTVSAGDGGFAIAATDPLFLGPGVPDALAYNLYVRNAGTVTGNVDLGYGSNWFENSGTFNAGEYVTIDGAPRWGTLFRNVVIGGDARVTGTSSSTDWFTNSGTLSVAGTGTVGTSSFVTSMFNQSAEGTMIVDVDQSAGISDVLSVKGDARLAGTVTPNLIGLAVGGQPADASYTFFQAKTIDAGDLQVADTIAARFSLNVELSSIGLKVDALQFDTEDLVEPGARAVAQHLDRIVASGQPSDLNDFMASQASIATGGLSTYSANFTNTLNDAGLHTANTLAPIQSAARNDQLHSCPVFVGETAALTETNCFYTRGIGGHIDGKSAVGGATYKTRWNEMAIGGQTEVWDGVFLGGMVSYGSADTTRSDGRISSDTDAVSVGGVVKVLPTSKLQFAFSGVYTRNSIETDRTTDSGAVAKSNFDTTTIGLRARASYYGDMGAFYLKPTFDLDAVRVDIPAYSETGAGAMNLHFGAADDWQFAATPMLELGKRIEGRKGTFRAFGRLGASFWSSQNLAQNVVFEGTPAGIPGFTVGGGGSSNYGIGALGAEYVGKTGLSYEARVTFQGNSDVSDTAFTARLRYDF
ncbi:autotransporter outer membrane beta-barrel domain-containing protein [Chachezhania sediminis]|uniref:autotransporter outer membrane beta-barrel domain-containing protein n=1 Tax=Chachezhania sediminis TaxID=2599291 RepID=UPI00131E8860|nr:autotransporter outer membrane beta-barrel domain-containing protein [Chachezhania sediminis]